LSDEAEFDNRALPLGTLLVTECFNTEHKRATLRRRMGE